jgi:broad specificity phosphatase PhoE
MDSYNIWLSEMRQGLSSLTVPTDHFLFLRHGTTDLNKQGIMIGHVDVPLDPQGYQEAEHVAGQLRSLPVSAVYSSDLLRTATTAQIIAQSLGIPVHTDARLRTRNYGSLSGQPRPTGNEIITPADAEPVAQFTGRVCDVFREVLNRPPLVLIVSHGGVRDALNIAFNIDAVNTLRATGALIQYRCQSGRWQNGPV